MASSSPAQEAPDIPQPLLCPITQRIMKDPVIAGDGHTYERKAVEAWWARGKRTSPATGARMNSLTLIPSVSIKQLIADFLELHPAAKEEQFDDDAEFQAALDAPSSASAGPPKPAKPAPAPAPSSAPRNPFAAPAPAPQPSQPRAGTSSNPFAGGGSGSPAASAVPSTSSLPAPPVRTFLTAGAFLKQACEMVTPRVPEGTRKGKQVVDYAASWLAGMPEAVRNHPSVTSIPAQLKKLNTAMYASARNSAFAEMAQAATVGDKPDVITAVRVALLAAGGMPSIAKLLYSSGQREPAQLGQAATLLRCMASVTPNTLHWWTCLGAGLVRRGKSKEGHVGCCTPPSAAEAAAAAYSSGQAGLTSARALQRSRSTSSSIGSAVATRTIGSAASVHDLWAFNVVYTGEGLVLVEDFDTESTLVAGKRVLATEIEQGTDARLQVVTDSKGKEFMLPPCLEDVLLASLYQHVVAGEGGVPTDAQKALKTMAGAGGEKRREVGDTTYYAEKPKGMSAWFSWGAATPSGFDEAMQQQHLDAAFVEPMLRCAYVVFMHHPTMWPYPRSAARRWATTLTAIIMSGKRGHTVRAWAAACLAVLARQPDVAASCAFGWKVPGGDDAAAGSLPPAVTEDPLEHYTVMQVLLAVAAKVRSPGAKACAAACLDNMLSTLLRAFPSDAAQVAARLPDGTAPLAAVATAAAESDARRGMAASTKSAAAAAPAAPSDLPTSVVAAAYPTEAIPAAPEQTSTPGAAEGAAREATLSGIALYPLLVSFHPLLPQVLCDLLLYGDTRTRQHASGAVLTLTVMSPFAWWALREAGVVEGLTSGLNTDETETKRAALRALSTLMDKALHGWPPAGALTPPPGDDAAASAGAGTGEDTSAMEGALKVLVGGWPCSSRASFITPPPAQPARRTPAPWDACAQDVARVGAVYVIAEAARQRGTRRRMGMQEQLASAAKTGTLVGSGEGTGELQFPGATITMNNLARSGAVGAETAARAGWKV